MIDDEKYLALEKKYLELESQYLILENKYILLEKQLGVTKGEPEGAEKKPEIGGTGASASTPPVTEKKKEAANKPPMWR